MAFLAPLSSMLIWKTIILPQRARKTVIGRSRGKQYTFNQCKIGFLTPTYPLFVLHATLRIPQELSKAFAKPKVKYKVSFLKAENIIEEKENKKVF